MGIGQQFAGLDMKNLIGGPLSAAAESSVILAKSTASFINEVGFDSNKNARTVKFKYTQKTPDPDGNVSDNEMAIDIPLLAIVPIPNLQIDEVNILFDMEVKNSEKSESSTNMSAEMSASARIGPFNISIKGSVASSSSNTRSSDNSAKYHVDVRATNHGIPEGLARVLDMMAASVAPNVVSTKAVDASGKELQGKAKEKNTKLKLLREERFRLEDAESSAQSNYELKRNILTDKAKNARDKMVSDYQAELNQIVDLKDADEAAKNANDEKRGKITKEMESYDNFWKNFNSSIANNLSAYGDPSSETSATLTAIYGAKSEEKFIPDVSPMEIEFTNAIEAMKQWRKSSQKLSDNKAEYNSVMIQN
ncbi:MAG: DUF2589 domain-containing protein [Oscillospiraceae bacterium]|nr:DUF2589 domain-containing protein [Oscillospiraceae bacterium]